MRSPPFSRAGPEVMVRFPPHFVGDDVGQRGFPQARWAVKENVIQGFGSFFGGGDGDFQGLHHLDLADIVGEGPGPEGQDLRRLVHGQVLFGEDAS